METKSSAEVANIGRNGPTASLHLQLHHVQTCLGPKLAIGCLLCIHHIQHGDVDSYGKSFRSLSYQKPTLRYIESDQRLQSSSTEMTDSAL